MTKTTKTTNDGQHTIQKTKDSATQASFYMNNMRGPPWPLGDGLDSLLVIAYHHQGL